MYNVKYLRRVKDPEVVFIPRTSLEDYFKNCLVVEGNRIADICSRAEWVIVDSPPGKPLGTGTPDVATKEAAKAVKQEITEEIVKKIVDAELASRLNEFEVKIRQLLGDFETKIQDMVNQNKEDVKREVFEELNKELDKRFETFAMRVALSLSEIEKKMKAQFEYYDTVIRMLKEAIETQKNVMAKEEIKNIVKEEIRNEVRNIVKEEVRNVVREELENITEKIAEKMAKRMEENIMKKLEEFEEWVKDQLQRH